MNKLRGTCIPLGLLAGLLISAPAVAADRTIEVAGTFTEEAFYAEAFGQTDRPHLIEGHYIVVLSGEPGRKNPRAAAALEALAKEIAQKPGAKINRTYKRVLTGFAAELTDEQVEELRRDPRVLAIEQDSYVYPDSNVQDHPTWGLDRIDQRGPLLDRAYAYTATGQGVTAYVMDSGIRFSHAEFGERASLGYDFVLEDDPDNTDPAQGPGEDCWGQWGHGTRVAGILGGSTYGVAKNVNLVSVRVFGCSGGSPFSRTLAAVDWVTEHAVRPAVVNMSFSSNNNMLSSSVENSIATGIHYVTSAGNADEDACLWDPGRSPGVLTVGATAIGDRKASFSNYGECVDLYAPGDAVLTAANSDDIATRYFGGTSASSPYAAGVVALYLEANPYSLPAEVHSAAVANSTQNAVTEVPSGTNNLLYSLRQLVEVTPPAWDFNLSTNGTKVRANQVVDLSWLPMDAWLEVYRDGARIGEAGWGVDSFRDNTGIKGNDATYVHKICASPQYYYLPACSENVTTIFGDGGDGGGGVDPNSPPSADFSYLADKLTVEFTDTSTDSDGTIAGWNWNFGDGNSSIAQHPLHTFSAAGTYTVSLTVTDNDGATGSTSKNISVSTGEIAPGDFVLNANGYKVKGRIIIDLSWSGSTSATVDIYRNGGLIAPGITNSGAYSDQTGRTGGGTFTHEVCEAGTATCSNVTSTTL